MNFYFAHGLIPAVTLSNCAIKAMRRHIALRKHFVQNSWQMRFLFAKARHGTSPSDGGLWGCVRVLAPLFFDHEHESDLLEAKL
jgi:hypothetical protein